MKSNIHLIGNAHLDPAWLWRFEEGFEAFLATCRSALERMRETPGFIFSCSSAACYEFVEQTDPALFKQIQQAVRDGRWEIVGGWWVEPDCNIPTGESFVRQALYGQRYFKEKFGKICTTGYCIDSFGHHANLPQLLKQSGMDSYVLMRPEAHELSLPKSLFRWQSPNGDQVLAYRIPFHYSNFRHSISEKLALLETSIEYHAELPWMLFYGVGNHGGGPTKQQIAEILGQQLQMSSVSAFFEDARKVEELPLVRDELQHHAIGCYSNHSAIKAANRRAEHALMRAEKFSVLSEELTRMSVNWQELDRAWKNVLLNQFHDTLGGVSPEDVCDEVLQKYGEAISIAGRLEQIALQRLANHIDTSDTVESLIIFNPHFRPYSGPVEFELWNPEASEQGKHIDGVTLVDASAVATVTQQIEASAKIGGDRVRFIANVEVPSFGWKRFQVQRSGSTRAQSRVTVTDKFVKNASIGFSIGPNDDLVGKMLTYRPLEVYRDESDTWAHGTTMFQEKIGEFVLRKVEIVDEGPIRGSIRLISEYNRSQCEELISLHSDSDEITIRTTLDWHEPHAVCKMSFSHGRSDLSFVSDIPYGVIRRDADGKEYPVVSWSYVSDGFKGLGVISDSKSSFSCTGDTLSMIVARSPLYAHHAPPHIRRPHETLHYLDHGVQQFTTKIVLGNTSHEMARMADRSQQFHERPVAHIESSHAGKLGAEYSGGDVIGEDVSVAVLKRSTDGNSAVLRLVSTGCTEGQSEVRLPLFKSRIESTLSPYQVRSYLISEGKVSPTSFLEEEL